MKVQPPATRWRLWVDGSGGYLLLTGTRWTVGGVSDQSLAEIRVRADWPRLAGRIEREAGDYFWCDRYVKGSIPTARVLQPPSGTLPVPGSASLTITQPSPLTATAVLDLKPPHRFDEHVDRVILVDHTLLIGDSAECHIRCESPPAGPPLDRLIMTLRGDRWLAGVAGDLRELVLGRVFQMQSVTMTLEQS
jgi:hypothetical protein